MGTEGGSAALIGFVFRSCEIVLFFSFLILSPSLSTSKRTRLSPVVVVCTVVSVSLTSFTAFPYGQMYTYTREAERRS